MKLRIFLLCLLVSAGGLLAQAWPALAEDQTINEDELFSGGDTVVSQEKVVNDNTGEELKENHIGFSGQFAAETFYINFNPDYDWTGLGGQDQDLLANQIAADFFLDVRLKQGVKGFLSFNSTYYPALTGAQKSLMGLPADTKSYTAYTVNEFFIDTNLNNRVYFRTGKQLLKWGAGYFWNPTDLINIDKKDFSDLEKIREGTYGEKVQLPFGTRKNVYFFVGMNEASTLDNVSLAGKYEFLVGNTEMSVSAVARKGFKPVYGYDFSGRLGDVDVRGEVALMPGGNQRTMNYDTLTLEDETGDWNPRVSLGFTKFFDLGNYKDRINLTGEFFYNAAGYNQNILSKLAGNPGAKPNFLSVYQPFMNSRYYLAVFSSVAKFLIPELTLNINALSNLVDHSARLTTGVTYKPAITNLTIDFHVDTNLGDENTEATFGGDRYTVFLGTKVLF
ncbi:MAG: hypothetical protein ACM3X9_12110 [Bacillota bacterium]